MTHLTPLPDRAALAVAGPDRVAFLQGLVSNDVALAAPGRAVWAALLTAQGKYLADFFIFATQDALLLDVAAADAAGLLARLSRYRLRAAVTLAARPDLAVYAAWGAPPALPPAAIAAPDPRLPAAGWRILSPVPLPATATAGDWDRHRLALGLPDGARDLEPERSLLLEAGFDELGGVSWTKGCYMGQELTARTKYRGLVKRRLVPVDVAGPLPAAGTPVLKNGAEVGTMRSGRGDIGLASLRLDAIGGGLVCGEATLTARIPAWLRLRDPAGAGA